MTKHVLDRPKTRSDARLVRAAQIERADKPSHATLALQRRNRARMDGKRMKSFTSIARDPQA